MKHQQEIIKHFYMKYLLTTVLVFLTFLGYSQSSAKSRVRSFLFDLKTQNWTFEKMYKDHMQFEVDSFKYNKDLIKANTSTMQIMANYLDSSHADISKLIIKREDKPTKKKHPNEVVTEWEPDPAPLSHKVYDANNKFLWHILLTEDHKICSILRYKEDKMFLVY